MSVSSLDPETDIMDQFPGPETDIMGERNFMLLGVTDTLNEKPFCPIRPGFTATFGF